MVNCPKCGARVREEYDFCPKCGTALKPAPPPPAAPTPAPPPPPYREEKHEKREKEERAEKREKEEKGEKHEKHEKYERRELSYLAPLVGGLILILLGLMLYMTTHFAVQPQIWVAIFFITIGVIVIIAGAYAVTVATRRSPQP